MAGHTEGPWYLIEDDEDVVHVTSRGRETRGLVSIAKIEVGYSGSVGKEQDANARLIAASPTLLDACREAEACMSIVEPGSDKAEYLRVLGVLRAAIAAATGSERGQS